VAAASHDQFSATKGTGPGCWASRDTLATECSSNATNVSTAISDLVAWGYFRRERQKGDGRRMTLRVLYDDDDTLPAGNLSAESRLPGDHLKTGDRLPKQGRYVAHNSPAARGNQQFLSGTEEHIPLKREQISSNRETNSAEAASIEIDATKDGKFLRKLQDWLKSGQSGPPPTLSDLVSVYARLREIEDAGDPHLGDPVAAWAQRLGGELNYIGECAHGERWLAARDAA